MAEAPEAFAILIARGEPAVFRRVIGPEIDIAFFLLDEQRGSGARGNLGIIGPQKIQRVGIEVLDQAEAWDAPPGAISYNVFRSTNSGGPYSLVGTSATTSYADTNVLPDVVYYYVVSAVTTNGPTTNSTSASAELTPLSCA